MYKLTVLTLLMLFSSGCKSFLFYHSSKFSVSAEVNPADPSQPGLVNVGMRDRVAMIVPPKEDDEEAVSSVNAFKLDYDTGKGLNDDKVEIESLLITGKAASNLGNESSKAFEAVGGFRPGITPGELSVIYNYISKFAGSDTVAAELQKSSETQAALILDTFSQQNLKVYKYAPSKKTLTDKPIVISNYSSKKFTGVTSFLAVIEKNIKILNMVIKLPDNDDLKVNGQDNTVDQNFRTGIRRLLNDQQKARKLVSHSLSNNPVFAEANNYFLEKTKGE